MSNWDGSGLRWVGESADTLSFRFQRESRLTDRRALRYMRRIGKLVFEQAVQWSPVDWKGPRGQGPLYELERSHKLTEKIGANRRIEMRIEVGGMVGEVDVDKYAMWVHDSIDWNQRGPATRAKDPEAGPFWLERALDKYDQDIGDDLLDELLDGLLS